MERLLSIYLSVALIGTPSSCKPSSESLIGGSQLLGVRSKNEANTDTEEQPTGNGGSAETGGETTASECFEYKGMDRDGKCMVKPDGTRIRASRIAGSYWPDDLAKPEKFERNAEGLASAKEWCNAEPKCMGFGVHYHYDRYYIFGAPNDGPEISSLVCNDPENNKCGDRAATNGCYVKYRCGESSPYDANVPTPEPSEVNGGWSDYGDWGKCAGGIQTRRRECNNPTPANGGTCCVGDNVEAQLCEELPVCERKYNGYYSYGDCGNKNGVESFGECCRLAREAQLKRSDINRFSWNGHSCAFKCGGTQDNRGGSWWSSTEDFSTCKCPEGN